jgi:outer membrane protein
LATRHPLINTAHGWVINQIGGNLGVNYTLFFDEDVDSEAAALGVTDIDNSVGPAAQVGVDYEFGNRWLINADARYIDIEAETSVDAAPGSTDVDVDVDVDPWVGTISVGYRF